jgi:hypothetical protein
MTRSVTGRAQGGHGAETTTPLVTATHDLETEVGPTMIRDATAVSSDRCRPAGVELGSLLSATREGPLLAGSSGSVAGVGAKGAG